MRNSTVVICCMMILLASVLLFVSSRSVKAQSGTVIFLGGIAGTTLAANCPPAPLTPSVCVVGDGAWTWQDSTTGWYKPAKAAVSGVTQITVNGGLPLTGPVALTIPTKSIVTSTGVLQ